jgi:acetyltransferase-like isoleucine patch superfamily enzyme
MSSSFKVTQPTVSIIIPSAHREEDNPHAIVNALSKFNFVNPNIEFIVVGEHCDLILESFENIKYVVCTHADPGCKRNLGIEISTGRYVTFLDADDLPIASAFQKVFEIIENENPEMLISNFVTYEEDVIRGASQNPIGFDITRCWEVEDLWAKMSLSEFNQTICPSILACYRLFVSKKVLTFSHIRFPCGFLGEDQVFAQRVLSAVDTISFLPSLTTIHEINPQGLSHNRSRLSQSDLASNLNLLEKESCGVKSRALRELLKDSNASFSERMMVAHLSLGSIWALKISMSKRVSLCAEAVSNVLLKSTRRWYLGSPNIFKKIYRKFKSAFYLGKKILKVINKKPLSGVPNIGVTVTRRELLGVNSAVIIGSNSICNAHVVFENGLGHFKVGSGTSIGGGTIVISQSHGIEVGDNTLISWDIFISDTDTHSLSNSYRSSDAFDWNVGLILGKVGRYKDWRYVKREPVSIGSNVWIGHAVTILPGVEICDNVVVGASSVVTKSIVEPGTYVGNPAKKLK